MPRISDDKPQQTHPHTCIYTHTHKTHTSTHTHTDFAQEVLEAKETVMMVLDNRQDILSWYQSRGYVLTQETVCMCVYVVCVRACESVWASVCYMRSWSACILTCMFTYNVCLCVGPPVNLPVSLLLLCPFCCVYVCHMKANA